MPRGRKPVPAIAPQDQQVVGAASTDHALVEIESNHRVAALAKRLNYSGALTPETFQDNIYRGKHRMVEGTLEVGTNLLLLKEAVGHGSFIDQLQVAGIAPRMAQKLMSASLKFANAPATAHLAGSQTKLLELLVLDDEEIAALESDGAIADITLDKIESMSHRELRDEIKKLRAQVEDTDGRIRVLTDKNEAAAQDVTAAKRKWREAKPDEHHDILRRTVTEAADRVRDVLGYRVADPEVGLRGAIDRLFEFSRNEGIDEADFVADTLAGLLEAVRWVRDHDDWPQAVPIKSDPGIER